MLSIAAVAGGRGNYYLSLARDDYYTKGGEPAGLWLGDGARELGLTGQVKGEDLTHLLKGFSADGGRKLVQNAGDKNHQGAWDLTFSCPKSVSVLWSQADSAVQRAFQEAQGEAVKEALDYLQEAAAFTRRGKRGEIREPTKLIVATFEHGTSRAQDPQLHTHALIANVGVRADGTGTILSQPLYAHKMAAGAVYRAELSNQLEKRLGVLLERHRTWFEVSGVPESIIADFSKRREDVERALLERGAAGAKASAKLTLATRQAKEHLPRAELIKTWQQVGRSHGFTADDVRGLLLRQGHREDLAGRVNSCIQAAAEKITQHESHFSERELIRRAAEEAQTLGIGAKFVRHLVKDALSRSPEFVCLGRSKGEIRYTTREMLALEKKMLTQVQALSALPSNSLPERTIQSVEGKLSDEQKKALRHVTQSPGAIHVVSGLAGTGKTSMLRATREAFEKSGYEVIGTCLSGKAASGLEEGSGIPSTTLAKLIGMPEVGYRGELDKGTVDSAKHHANQLIRAALGKGTWPLESIRLTPKSVLVVDEAGMVGTRQMERLTERVLEAGARLILVGDEKQLQAIEAGGPFASIGNRIGRTRLTDIKRQKEEWARDAVKKIAYGQGALALREYASRGLVTVSDDRKDAMNALIASWKAAGAQNPKDNLILASTNAEVTRLNRMAQVERMLRGELGKQCVAVSGTDFHHGDRVVFTRNSKRYGVENGCLGTVVAIDSRHKILTVSLDKGRHAMISTSDYEHLKLGYAVTTYKAQGLTTENAHVLLGGPMQDRELSYVQASRARGTTRFFLDKFEAGDDLRELSKELQRSRQKDLSHDVLEAGGRENIQSRNILVQRIE